MKISTYIQTTEQRDAQTVEHILTGRLEKLLTEQAASTKTLKAKYADRFPSPKV